MESIIHEWESNGKRYQAVYDNLHETRGSYAYDTEEETKVAEDEEISKLVSGEWIAIGIRVYERKPHCATCTCPPSEHSWAQTDDCWGIVVENTTAAIERYARDCM